VSCSSRGAACARFSRDHSYRRLAYKVLACLLMAGSLAACSGGGVSPSPGSGSTASNRIAKLKSIVQASANGSYIGAYVNPTGGQGPTEGQLETETEALEGDPLVNKFLTTHLHYMNWTALLQATSDSGLASDRTLHRTPIISWSCGDDHTLDGNGKPLDLIEIANGFADADLENISTQLAKLQGTQGGSYPVLLRYFWEFNINAANVPGYTNASAKPTNDGCFTPQGAATGIPAEPYAPALPLQFKQAWIHIWQVFSAVRPRPNVSFVWNPSVIGSIDDGNVAIDASPYYPGNQYVDWIAGDGYDRVLKSTGLPEGYAQVFGSFYSEYTQSLYQPNGIQVPLMIGETAACQQYDALFPPQYDQVAYINSLSQALQSLEIAPSPNFPAIQSLNYFDSDTGSYEIPTNHEQCIWALTSGSNGGVGAYGQIMNTPFFEQSIPGS